MYTLVLLPCGPELTEFQSASCACVWLLSGFTVVKMKRCAWARSECLGYGDLN